MSVELKNAHVADLSGSILTVCNPLLDISAEVDATVLDKYGVSLNSAILAEEKHLPIFQELTQLPNVQYIAGGSAQNTARVCQWMLGKPGSVSFVGSVGNDKNAEILRQCVAADHVNAHYHTDDSATGTCAVLVNNKERSLITNLSAANNYKLEHMLSDDVRPVWEKAQLFYVSGFFLTVSVPSIMHLAEHALAAGKTFSMNLSAAFISQFFSEQLMQVMPYVDILFGNESEAAAFAEKFNVPYETLGDIALAIAALPKKNESRPRLVVITHGPEPTSVAYNGVVQRFEVPTVPKEEIVDANGAGDAFVGGFLSQYIQGKTIKACCSAGNFAARRVLGVSGTALHGKPNWSE